MRIRQAKSLPILVLFTATAGFSQTFTDTPSVVANTDGRLEIFARGSDGAAWHNWQVSRGGAWSGWSSFGGWIAATPAAAINADGRLEIFVLGGANIVYHNYQTSPAGGWSGWISLGGPIATTPTVARNADGRLEIFAQGTDGAGWHARQQIPGDYWSGWDSFGGWIAASPAAIQNADGRLEIFALGGANTVFHNWQTSPGGVWSGWNSLGGSIASTPTVGINNDGRLEIFAQGTDIAAWHAWQQVPGASWSGWQSMGGGMYASPPAIENADGGLDLFSLGGGNAVYYSSQPSLNGAWNGWPTLGGALISTPSVEMNFDGREEIFGVAADGTVWHNWQLSPGYAASWSGWAPISQSSDTGTTNTADLPDLITESQNNANYVAAKNGGYPPPWRSSASAWPCGARVNFFFIGYEKKALTAFQSAISEWNAMLSSRYSSGYAPVQLYTNAGGPQSVHVYPVADDSIPGSLSGQYGRALTTNEQTDAQIRLFRADIQIIRGMTESPALTNTLAHEIGHTFGLNDCSKCGTQHGPTVMDTDEVARLAHGWDYIAKNFSEGLAGPTVNDMNVIGSHLSDFATCGIAENSPPPAVPACTNGQAVGFLDTGTGATYTCGSPCDGCNSACNNFAPQNCGGGGGGGGGGCSNWCGNICLDGTFCEADGSIPQCEFLSQGFCPVCPYSPIVIDAFGEGFHLTSFTEGVKFRVLPPDSPSQMSWTDQRWHNGWLALDRNGNGKIDDFTELFGNVTAQPRGDDPNGYTALAMFDDPMNGGNGNGAIDPGDSVYNHLRLWIDANHNGLSELEELHTLRETGIFRIGLNYRLSQHVDANGNQFRYKSRIWDDVGRSHDVCYDVFLRVEARGISGGAGQ